MLGEKNKTMSEVERLIKLRDSAKEAREGLDRLVYALNEYLGELPPPGEEGLQKVRALFPKELQELLSFDQTKTHFVVKPRQYLGSDKFAQIAAICREADGEYISQGKNSHFKIQKGK